LAVLADRIRGALVRSAFRAVDRNRDGLVSESELRADAVRMWGHHEDGEFPEDTISLGDADGDGKLSLHEFFQTVRDPENDREDLLFWKNWFTGRRVTVAERSTQRSRTRPAGP